MVLSCSTTTVFELVLVVQHWIVQLSVHPHPVDDFEPTLAQATQGIGVTLTFIAMMAVGPQSSWLRKHTVRASKIRRYRRFLRL